MTAAVLPALAARAPVNKWLVTLSVTFGTLMGAIDTSIVAVATPHLTGSLGATVEEMTWVTTGFVIATVVVMPLTAFLGRFFGQKRVYLFSLGLFIAGSALCGRASGIVARVHIRENQPVKRGDVLIELDPAEFKARAQQAEAELANAQAQAAVAEAQVAIVEASSRGGLASARAALSGTAAGVGSAEAQAASARAAANRAAADLKKAELDLARACVRRTRSPSSN